MPLDIDPTNDYAFKKLFGTPANADLLIDLLNAVLSPLAIVEIELLSPFNEKGFADDKLSVLDIKARDDQGVWYNVEVQSRVHWSLPARLAYYNARLYVDQFKAGGVYGALAPAITICFLSENLFDDISAPHLRFSLFNPKHNLELTDRLQVHTIELAKYNFEGVALATAERLNQWAYFFRNARRLEAEELHRLLPQPEFVKAIGVVEMIAQTPQERLEYEARLKAETDYRSFIYDARHEGLAEGKAEGKVEGKAEGREEGRRQVLVEQVRLFQQMLKEPLTLEQDLLSLSTDVLVQRSDELKERLLARG